MKKLILSIALASAVAFASAQDMTSKKGVPILPEAGDWSIGFDAVPVLDAIGNIFHDNAGTGPFSQQDFTLVGGYVKDETTTYRGKLRIGIGSSTQEGAVSDSTLSPTKTEVSNGFALTIGAGLQKNRGKGRLRGIYGAEVSVTLGPGKDSTFTFSQPTPAVAMTQTTEIKAGNTFGVGLNGFIGAEFFFAPKMSVSAEYGWGFALTSTSETENTVTEWDTNGAVIKTTTSKGQKSSGFNLDVINAGQLVLHCYF